MKTLFESANVEEIQQRLARLKPDSQRLWGKMDVAQALAHCIAAFEIAEGKALVPRIWLGRIFGRIAKLSVIHKQSPIPRNSPAPRCVVIADERVFASERDRLRERIDQFATVGPVGCSSHPHFFFGKLTPEEWSSLMYQHLDHHFRQFGA